MKKILLTLLGLAVIQAEDANARGIYGIERLYNKATYLYEDYGVKVSQDSDFIFLGDIIDFEVRGKAKGKMEVFSREVNEERNFLYIKGYDLTNKVNREFKFPLK